MGFPWITIPPSRSQQKTETKEGMPRGCTNKAKKATTQTIASKHFLLKCEVSNKLDKCKLQITKKIINDCCILLITEAWLNSFIPETAIKLAGFTACQLDRTENLSKKRGGCVFSCTTAGARIPP